MARADKINASFQKLLGRNAGTEGQTYWGNQWQSVYDNAIASNASAAAAEAAATASIESGIGAGTEAKTFSRTGITRATTLDDAGVAGFYRGGARDEAADWYTAGTYTADDDNEYARGTRDVDWAAKLNTTNLENYLDNQNYQYGVLQGNTVGQEGSEYWGYQKTAAIDHYMSNEGGDYSFETASKLADFDITRDIKANTGHKNFERYGSIGYGNPLSIKTNLEANVAGTAGDSEFGMENVYLNFNEKAMDELRTRFGTAEGEDLVTTGSITGDQGNQTSAFTYVADASAPGGFRIGGNTNVAKTISGELSGTGSEGTVVDQGYLNDRGLPTFAIPDTVTNVDASRFTLPDNALNADGTINYGEASNTGDKLTLGQWAETEGGKAAIAAGDFSYKNLGLNKVSDGQGGETLVAGSSTVTGGADQNLGLDDGETLVVTNKNGEETTLTGGTTTNNTTYVGGTTYGGDEILHEGDESNISNYYYGSGGGGKTIVNTAVPQKSKTAKQQQKKDDPRVLASAPNRKQYQKIKTTPGAAGNVAQLGIVT